MTNGSPCTLDEVIQYTRESCGAEYGRILIDLATWSDSLSGRLVQTPHPYHERSGPVYKYYTTALPRREFWAFWPKQWKIEMFFRARPPLDAGTGRAELDRLLRTVPGVNAQTFPATTVKVLKLDALLTPESRRAFCRVMHWALVSLESGTPAAGMVAGSD